MDKRELEIVKCRCGKKPDLVDRKGCRRAWLV